MLNRRGAVLITAYLIMLALLILSGAFFGRTLHENRFFEKRREQLEAFYLAEAAVDIALHELNSNYAGYTGTPSTVSLGRGEYDVTVQSLPNNRKLITVSGYIPDTSQTRALRQIEAVAIKEAPTNFYDHAIYSANEVDLNGNSYSVTGDVVYAGSIDNPDNITGTYSQDPTVSPLAALDFDVLRSIANIQGNIYDSSRLQDVQNGSDSFPTSFYNVAPDPMDPSDVGVPNVVYVEGDMVLNGNIGTIGGFYLVVGDVLNNPGAQYDSSINGNGTVEGCIYTTGKFRVNGGGGVLNINGGVWAGTEAELNGNAEIQYDADFMNSIQELINSNAAGSVVQLMSWREM